MDSCIAATATRDCVSARLCKLCFELRDFLVSGVQLLVSAFKARSEAGNLPLQVLDSAILILDLVRKTGNLLLELIGHMRESLWDICYQGQTKGDSLFH